MLKKVTGELTGKIKIPEHYRFEVLAKTLNPRFSQLLILEHLLQAWLQAYYVRAYNRLTTGFTTDLLQVYYRYATGVL